MELQAFLPTEKLDGIGFCHLEKVVIIVFIVVISIEKKKEQAFCRKKRKKLNTNPTDRNNRPLHKEMLTLSDQKLIEVNVGGRQFLTKVQHLKRFPR